MKKALIDIDNTLWNFSEELEKQLKTKNINFPSCDQWHEWDFWKNNCSEKDYWDAVNYIHLNQDKFVPFSGIGNFLKALKSNGFYIIIMSYRIPESYNFTFSWLKNNDLEFDELKFPEHKKDLFDENCKIVIDDEPGVLEEARKMGIVAVGLNRFPIRDGQNNCQLFHDWEKLGNYVLEKVNIINS